MALILDTKITTKLAFAVSLLDDFTRREEVFGGARVGIPSIGFKAVENHCGYHNFLDIPDGTYAVNVKTDYYIEYNEDFTSPRAVTLSLLGAAAGSTYATLATLAGLMDGDVVVFDNHTDPPESRTVELNPSESLTIRWDRDPRGGLSADYGPGASVSVPSQDLWILKTVLRPAPNYPFPGGATLIRGFVKDNTSGNPLAGAELEVLNTAMKTRTTDIGGFVLYFPAAQVDASVVVNVTPVGGTPRLEAAEVKRGRTTSLDVIFP